MGRGTVLAGASRAHRFGNSFMRLVSCITPVMRQGGPSACYMKQEWNPALASSTLVRRHVTGHCVAPAFVALVCDGPSSARNRI